MLPYCRVIQAVYLIIWSIVQHLSNLRAFLLDGTCLRIIDVHVFSDKQHGHLGHQNFLNIQCDHTDSHETVGTCDISGVRAEMVHDVGYALSNRQNGGVPVKSTYQGRDSQDLRTSRSIITRTIRASST